MEKSLHRAGAVLAACALLLGACSKAGTDAQGKTGVGTKIDGAVEKTSERLSKAGERAKEEVADAAGKTQETLSKAGERISEATAAARANITAGASSAPPYSPRQPVGPAGTPGPTGGPAGGPFGASSNTATTAGGDPATTTNTLSSGPTVNTR